MIEAGPTLPSDNDLCTKDDTSGVVSCSAQQRGSVYAECRDGSGRNDGYRQIIATLDSDPVTCGSSVIPPPMHTYHVSSVKMWCQGVWEDRGNTCSAVGFNDATWGNLCYADQYTSTTIAQPAMITMSSIGFENCIVTGGQSLAPPVVVPVMEEVGNGAYDAWL